MPCLRRVQGADNAKHKRAVGASDPRNAGAGNGGTKGQPNSGVRSGGLAAIRTRANFGNGGNLQEMQRIGEAVYKSVTNPAVHAALDAALQISSANRKNLRICLLDRFAGRTTAGGASVRDSLRGDLHAHGRLLRLRAADSREQNPCGQAGPTDRSVGPAAADPVGGCKSSGVASRRHRKGGRDSQGSVEGAGGEPSGGARPVHSADTKRTEQARCGAAATTRCTSPGTAASGRLAGIRHGARFFAFRRRTAD